MQDVGRGLGPGQAFVIRGYPKKLLRSASLMSELRLSPLADVLEGEFKMEV